MTVNFPQPLRLAVGSHQAGSGKGCAMNVISWENGDTTITDFPSCSDPFLAIVVQRINDNICTHRQGDLLCSDCSIKVLEIGHRTVGTNLNHTHSAAERAAERAEIYAKIARTEVFYIAAAPGAAAADAAAAAAYADAAAAYAYDAAVRAADAAAAAYADAAAAYADAAAAYADAAAAAAAAAADAAYDAAVRAADADAAAAAAAAAAQAERIFNQFEAFSGIKSKPVDKQVVIEAVQKMRTVSV